MEPDVKIQEDSSQIMPTGINRADRIESVLSL